MTRTIKAAIVLIGMAFLAACGTTTPLTEKQEYFVGRSVSANLMGTYTLVQNNPGWQEYLTWVGSNLAQSSDRPATYGGYHFALVEHEGVNAFASPGGFIFVTTGAIRAMENEDELAGVLAHEISHVVLKHPEAAANAANQKRQATGTFLAIGEAVVQSRNKGREQAQWDALKSVFQEVIDEVVLDIVVKGYDRDQEYEADKAGTQLLLRMGYDPYALRNFLARLARDPGLNKDSEHVLGWVGRTHPQPADRVQRLNTQLGSHPAEPVAAQRKKRFHDMKQRLK